MMRYYQQFYKCFTRDADGVLYATIDTTRERCAVDAVVVVDRFCGFDFEQIPRIKSVIVLCVFLRNGSFHLDKSFLSCIPRQEHNRGNFEWFCLRIIRGDDGDIVFCLFCCVAVKKAFSLILCSLRRVRIVHDRGVWMSQFDIKTHICYYLYKCRSLGSSLIEQQFTDTVLHK